MKVGERMDDNILPHILIVLLVLLVCCTIVQNFIMQDTIDTQEDTIATMQEIIDILEESR